MSLPADLREFSDRRRAAKVVDDPFRVECIESCHIHIYPKYTRGTVEFKRGDFGGERSFRADSFPEVVTLMETFINELPNGMKNEE